jgi:hypothetical protein
VHWRNSAIWWGSSAGAGRLSACGAHAGRSSGIARPESPAHIGAAATQQGATWPEKTERLQRLTGAGRNSNPPVRRPAKASSSPPAGAGKGFDPRGISSLSLVSIGGGWVPALSDICERLVRSQSVGRPWLWRTRWPLEPYRPTRITGTSWGGTDTMRTRRSTARVITQHSQCVTALYNLIDNQFVTASAARPRQARARRLPGGEGDRPPAWGFQ